MAKLYFSKGKEAKQLSRRFKRNGYHAIRQGIYVDSSDSHEIFRVIESKWPDIAAFIFKDPIVVDRTAVELCPKNGKLYFESKYYRARRKVQVGHLEFVLRPGRSDCGVEQFTLDVKKSNSTRMCLENLAISKGKYKKALGQRWVEERLSRIINERGEEAINSIKDEARIIAPLLNLDREFSQLEKIISAILSTHPIAGVLQTKIGIAQAKGEPFDQVRVDILESLSDYLKNLNLTKYPYSYTKSSWRNLSFFESYFSNYIEGTEFTIEEAEEIVFEGKNISQRHEDSHDVSAHMEICSDLAEMKRVPSSAEEFLNILKVRHQLLLDERPSKRPGKFKTKDNKAGSTVFVAPEYVEGTLVQGFEIYKGLAEGFQRAVFMHFLVSECHPFDDGNGRISRIMMNAELFSDDQIKVIVPTVHRDSYLNGLRKASRSSQFRAMIKVLHQLQAYELGLSWDDYGEVKAEIQQSAADKEPDEGVAIFNKVISKLGGEYPAG